MNSAPLSSANDVRDAAYHRNQVKSLCFLALLAVVLVAAALLSLRAGSYNTPLAELVRGVFGLAQDEKVNLVVQGQPACPASAPPFWAARGWGWPGAFYRPF